MLAEYIRAGAPVVGADGRVPEDRLCFFSSTPRRKRWRWRGLPQVHPGIRSQEQGQPHHAVGGHLDH